MKYQNFINEVKNTAGNKYIKSFFEGDVFDKVNLQQFTYPGVVMTVDNITPDGDYYNVNCYIYYIDRLTSNADNNTGIQSVGIAVLDKLFNDLNEVGLVTSEVESFKPFTYQFNDLCAGVYATATLSYQKENLCD